MAYSALVSLSETTNLILNPRNKYSISVAEKEQITSISKHAISLMSLLETHPKKASCLEGEMRDVAAAAEDIIEGFMWDQIHASSESVGPTRAAFEQHLIRAGEEIGSIIGDMMDDRLRDSPAAAISSTSSRLASTGKNDIVVGLDEELIAIKSRLCNESSKLEVIPILGMGGIGKSTLARCAFDDRLSVESFKIRAWITISQDYSAQETLSCLRDSMKSYDEQMLGHDNEATMRDKIYKCLKGRRYLIVMDDVWSTKALDDVRNIFPDDRNGSRIMLTTRLSNVASYAVSGSLVHEMKFMDKDQCWNLLKHKVFTNLNGQGCPSELEDVGKEIATSCRGLPLAVVLIAGVLSKMVETRASWEEILKNLNSIVGEQLEEILTLSNTYLPHNLRSCFLYLGGFPEYHEVRVSKLIKLWMAEGFLKRTHESKSLEEEAEEYLEDLVERSLVLVSSRKSNGKIKSCSLHDLVRDLCIRKAGEEKFLIHAKDECADVRRLSITTSNNLYNICGSTIRTILCFQRFEESCSVDLLGGVKLLRVLEVANDSEEDLPFQIFEQFHLRYLASWKLTKALPTISKLENLQTLIISRKTIPIDISLPLEVLRMPQLRHLIIYYLYKLPYFPPSTPPLENLKTLLVVRGSEQFLKMFPNVKKLGIIYDRSDSDRVYRLPNLSYLNQLEKFKVIMGDFCEMGRNSAFPRTLKKLTLSGGSFPWKYMFNIGSLPYLQVLKLINYACAGDTWETADGEFCQLEFLLIEKSKLRDWKTECSHFPTLKCLILHLCLYISEVPDSIVEIPSLEMIEVDNRNKHLVKSAKMILEDQQSQGNYDLQVRIVGCLHESLSLDKTSGKKCYMMGARELLITWSDNLEYWQWNPCAVSRFSVVAELKKVCWLEIEVKIKTEMLSSNTTYAAYLVFNLAEGCRELESANAMVRFVNDEDVCAAKERSVVVVHLQQADSDDGRREQNGRHPVWRDDGWMEIELGSFYNDDDDDDGEVEARLNGIGGKWKSGLIIEGIEFRPRPQSEPADGSYLPLENLQSLSEVKGLVCSDEFLKTFQNVKRLGLVYDQNNSRRQDYQLYNLSRLYQLEKLKVTMRDFFWAGRNPAFPRTLKELSFSGGGFPWKDMTIIGSLPNLEALELINHACHGDTWETSEGEFPQLKFLLIEKSTLLNWITECSHFPILKRLILRFCQSLSHIPSGIIQIPSLEMIEVDYLNKFLVQSAREIQEDLQRNRNDALQVRIVSGLHECISVEKTSGKKCYMIGARELVIVWSDTPQHWQWKFCADSRFSEVAELIDVFWLDIRVIIKTLMLSSNTTYAAYLVFKLAEGCYGLEQANAIVRFVSEEDAEETSNVVYLQLRADDGAERAQVQRDDGWMEVEMGSFYNDGVDDDGEAEARLTGIPVSEKKSGLIVEGIEFRPKTIFEPWENVT